GDVDAVSTITEEKDLDVSPRVFDSELNVHISDSGHVKVSLFSMEGRCVLANDFNAQVGDTLTVHPDVPTGVYILRVECNGMLLGSAKVIRR
ncbi:MAG: T9SS type A sorting domain-containing protein, partial [Muribaculaceae bacterium]|nr:T9SS type A sorting domain-containing protein [Muribaculaceae bacterium]